MDRSGRELNRITWCNGAVMRSSAEGRRISGEHWLTSSAGFEVPTLVLAAVLIHTSLH